LIAATKIRKPRQILIPDRKKLGMHCVIRLERIAFLTRCKIAGIIFWGYQMSIVAALTALSIL